MSEALLFEFDRILTIKSYFGEYMDQEFLEKLQNNLNEIQKMVAEKLQEKEPEVKNVDSTWQLCDDILNKSTAPANVKSFISGVQGFIETQEYCSPKQKASVESTHKSYFRH